MICFKEIVKSYFYKHPKLYRFLWHQSGKFVVRGVNNHVSNNAFSLKDCTFSVKGDDNIIDIKEGVRLNNVKVDISGNGHRLIFHKDVRIREGGRIRVEDNSNRLEIGENSSLVNVYFNLQDHNTFIMIGKDCLLSSKITFRTSDSHSIIDRKTGNRINPGKSIWVGDHVWIGNGVTVLKGVSIGKGCIIGTCSLVTKDIPDNCLAVGVPAKVVKEDIDWDKVRIHNNT